MTDRYQKIRKALAMRPTPGPWYHGAKNGQHKYCVYDKVCWTDEYGRHGETPNMVVCVSPDDGKYANATYIAACDPDTILALLDERDALAAENARLLEALKDANDEKLDFIHDGDCYGDGTVYRGQRSKDSTIPTYTLNDLPKRATQLMESLRKLEEQAQRDEALLRQALEALIWTTGSEDFGEGGLAREGALKLLFPTVAALRERLGKTRSRRHEGACKWNRLTRRKRSPRT